MKRLNLGCGKDIKEGWINLDIFDREGVDIVHDLNELPLQFKDNDFDFVLCKDILEHVKWILLINEINRILKPKGILLIRVPHFTSAISYTDPTHKNYFSINSFEFFIKSDFFNYERKIRYFSKIKKKILFKKENTFLAIINKFLEKIVNKSQNHQNFYEESFLRVFPAYNIEIILIK